ncbi:uncharacterized protein LY79DRAFT_296867 [Colletotrichum navitas]|uniref:Uncharacterized protein n=1 Tax=Colletotrichum navitas TaxID=681940 RepID=A0AAD8V3I2_9PEZI|nr:uncharacterized protein LY79DRAFT_296867 [Colletotrichum navitas]KAK1580748.1 hypothetical protein LY79DRAFT_296867 [Colletotrichum navitas]
MATSARARALPLLGLREHRPTDVPSSDLFALPTLRPQSAAHGLRSARLAATSRTPGSVPWLCSRLQFLLDYPGPHHTWSIPNMLPCIHTYAHGHVASPPAPPWLRTSLPPYRSTPYVLENLSDKRRCNATVVASMGEGCLGCKRGGRTRATTERGLFFCVYFLAGGGFFFLPLPNERGLHIHKPVVGLAVSLQF